MPYRPSNYNEEGGARTVIGGSLDVASGGDLDLESGSTLKVAGVAQSADVTFAAAAGGANVSEVTCTVVDNAGSTIAGVFNLDVWLSDAATGAGLTATAASGTVTAKAASGAVVGTYTAKKALRVQTLATGVFILEITDTAKTGFYVAAAVPGTGATTVSDQLVSGDYGA